MKRGTTISATRRTMKVVRGIVAAAATAAAAGCSVVGAPAGAPPGPPSGAPWDTAGALPRRPARPGGPEVGPVRTFREVRGLWVIRTSLSTPERVDSMVAAAAQAGFNTLLVQVRGRGDAFYDSRWEPRAERLADQPRSFDPLARVIREAHARGMAVHAWIDTHLVWSGDQLPASPEHLVNARPDWLAVPRGLAARLYDMDPTEPRYVDALLRYAAGHADGVEGLYTSPSDPGVKERVYDVCVDLAERYDLDGIHLDYIRYPSADYDYARGALDRFRAWVAPRLPPNRLAELDAAYASDPFAFTDALPGPWAEFRRAQVTDLVERVYQGVKARRPAMVMSAAVFANADDAYRNRFQDWHAWLDAGSLDVAVPMAYTPDDGLFRAQVGEAVRAAGRQGRVWAGIGAYLNTPEGTLDKIDIARREGVGGVVLFSYDWAAYEAPTNGEVPYLLRIGREKFGR